MLGMSFTVPGDLELSADRRDLLLLQGGEEIRQRADVALKTFHGTWLFDSQVGLRTFEDLFGKPAPLALWKAEITRVLRTVAGIESVLSVVVAFDRPTRSATVTWSASTNAGVVRSEVTYS